MQILPEKKWVYALLFAALSAGAVYLNSLDVEVSNANVNILVCMPFFLVGYFLKPLKSVLNNLHNYYIEAALLVVSVSLVIVCGHYNGYVWMYLCGYGNNYILYIIGGMVGAVMLYVVSLWLSRLSYRRMILTLSKGSILIIGLHIVLVRRLVELPNRMWGEDFLFSILIMLCFVPIIRVVDRIFPILLGRYPNNYCF